MWKKLISLKLWAPIVILSTGIGLVVFFLNNKPEARKRSNPFRGTLVEIAVAKKSSPRIELKTHGRVRAAQRIVLTAQLTGVVNWISPLLVEGNFFRTGDLLLTLDPLNGMNLDQTLLKAPFNGVVQTRNVDLGQHVNTGAQLATLIGSDKAEIISDVPVNKLDWLVDGKPLKNEVIPNEYQQPADISMKIGNQNAEWKGQVQRYLLELTPSGMMVQLILEVNDPFGLGPSPVTFPSEANPRTSETGLSKSVNINDNNQYLPIFSFPLFIGAFVDISIPGRRLGNVIQLPVNALRDRNTVWRVDAGELEIRTVEIAHIEGDNAYISAGLEPGDKVVTSPLKGVANGLKVRLAGKTAPRSQQFSPRAIGKGNSRRPETGAPPRKFKNNGNRRRPIPRSEMSETKRQDRKAKVNKN